MHRVKKIMGVHVCAILSFFFFLFSRSLVIIRECLEETAASNMVALI